MSALAKKLDKLKMKPDEIKEIVKFQYNQLLNMGTDMAHKCMFIEGFHGVGKTSVGGQIAKELTDELRKSGVLTDKQKVHCKVLNLTAKEATDFTGLPTNITEQVTDDDGNTTTKVYSTFGHPKDLPDQGYGILFLDEANRVQDKDMKSTLLSLLNDRGVNDNFLGKNWLIILAGNPFDDDNYEVGEFDDALLDRVDRVFYETNHDIVYKYLSTKKNNEGKVVYEGHFLLDFLGENPNFINYSGGKNEKSGDMSPRRFEKAMIATQQFGTDYESNRAMVTKLLRLSLGTGASKKVEMFLNDVQIPKVDDILKNKAKTMKMVAKIKNNNAQISGLNKGLITKFKSLAEKKKALTHEQGKGVINYVHAISSENKLAFTKSLFQEDNPVVDLIISGVLQWKPKAKDEDAEEMIKRQKEMKTAFLKVHGRETKSKKA